MFNIMNYNEINLTFADFCICANKLSPNNFDDKCVTQPIKRIIAFNDNYEKLTHKEFYVIYDIHGTFQPYCIEYKQENKLIQRNTFSNLRTAIEYYNNIEL